VCLDLHPRGNLVVEFEMVPPPVPSPGQPRGYFIGGGGAGHEELRDLVETLPVVSRQLLNPRMGARRDGIVARSNTGSGWPGRSLSD